MVKSITVKVISLTESVKIWFQNSNVYKKTNLGISWFKSGYFLKINCSALT